MEMLVRNAICQYNTYVSEARLYEKWFFQMNDEEASKKMHLIEMKISTINAWLNLLSYDEKFVIEKHLIDGIEWARIAFEFRERWNKEFFRTERTLQIYQAKALKKIALFANAHREITLSLFSDLAYQAEG